MTTKKLTCPICQRPLSAINTGHQVKAHRRREPKHLPFGSLNGADAVTIGSIGGWKTTESIDRYIEQTQSGEGN